MSYTISNSKLLLNSVSLEIWWLQDSLPACVVQVEQVLALKLEPGSVTRHMWVLSDSMSSKVHCWPKLQDVVAAEYAAKVTEVNDHSNIVLPSQKHHGNGTQHNISVMTQAMQTSGKALHMQETASSTVSQVGTSHTGGVLLQ